MCILLPYKVICATKEWLITWNFRNFFDVHIGVLGFFAPKGLAGGPIP